jgi:hypothetical protein
METIVAIKAQYALAARGAEQDLITHRTNSGVKDEIAVYWQDLLLKRARQLAEPRLKNRDTRDPTLNQTMTREGRAELVESIRDGIEKDNLAWLYMQPPDSYARLPAGSCMMSHADFFFDVF